MSTLLEEGLYRRAKLEAALEGKQISEIIGEALKRYLDERGRRGADGGVVDETWGAMEIGSEELRTVMNEDDWIEAG